jgi:hypothetical protein
VDDLRSIDQSLAARCVTLRQQGVSRDDIITVLHKDGASILQTILAVKSAYEMPTHEAKNVVGENPVWRDLARRVAVDHAKAIEIINSPDFDIDDPRHYQD